MYIGDVFLVVTLNMLTILNIEGTKFSIGIFSKWNSSTSTDSSGVFILEHLVLKEGVVTKFSAWCLAPFPVVFQIWRPFISKNREFFSLISQHKVYAKNSPSICQVNLGSRVHPYIRTNDGDRLGFYCEKNCPLAYTTNRSMSPKVRILQAKVWNGERQITHLRVIESRLYSIVVDYDTDIDNYYDFKTTTTTKTSTTTRGTTNSVTSTSIYKNHSTTRKLSTKTSIVSTSKASSTTTPLKINTPRDVTNKTTPTSTTRSISSLRITKSSKQSTTTTPSQVNGTKPITQNTEPTVYPHLKSPHNVSLEEGDVLLGGEHLVDADNFLRNEADLIHILGINTYQLPNDGYIKTIWLWISNDGLLEFQIWRKHEVQENENKVSFTLISKYGVHIKGERGITEIGNIENLGGKKGDHVGVYNLERTGVIGYYYEEKSSPIGTMKDNHDSYVAIGDVYETGRVVKMFGKDNVEQNNEIIHFCIAVVFVPYDNNSTHNSTIIPKISSSMSYKKPQSWWTNRTLVITLIAWLLGVTVTMATACSLIACRSYRKRRLLNAPESSSTSVNEYKPRSIRNRTAFSQWIGGMRADEAIDYYMPSIAARSSHRSVSFARSRPTTINPVQSRENSHSQENSPATISKSSACSPATTALNSPAYARPISTKMFNGIDAKIESPHVTRLKYTVNGFSTKM